MAPDRLVAAIAAGQHGVSRGQLLGAGLTAKQVKRRLQTGRLHPLHRGIYAVGHTALPSLARHQAALLATGEGSVLSSLTAAVLWELVPDGGEPIHVTTNSRRRAASGVAIHQAGLRRDEIRHLHGLPVTSPARTLRDLAAHTDERRLARAVNEALVRRLVRPPELTTRDHRGARALRAALAAGPTVTRSEAERRLLDLVRRAGLPRPETNVRLHGFEVDVLWREQRLVVEVDGYAFHSTRAAFERDRVRDAELQARGLTVLRITWRRLTERPEALAAHLGGLLLSPRPAPSRTTAT